MNGSLFNAKVYKVFQRFPGHVSERVILITKVCRAYDSCSQESHL